jgi:hypothetical protein
MELYILDSLLRRTELVDRFESLIWTERYAAWGDFELDIFSTPATRRLFKAGKKLASNVSYRVMTVEDVENAVDSEGRQLLKVKGRSLEAILEDRVARNTFKDLETTPKWVVVGRPGDVVRKIFNAICRDNPNFADDEIPFLKTGSIMPSSNIPEPANQITVELDPQSVYQAITEICEAYDLGYRLLRNFDNSELYFDVYSGSDRTNAQTILAPVVFSPELDNLTNTSEITSISKLKNVAYVFHPIAVQIVYADGVSSTVDGFERRVMYVDASSIEVPDRTYTISQTNTDAINAAIGKAANDSIAKKALQKLIDKKRMTTEEAEAITTFLSSAALTTEQKASINQARTQSLNYNTMENNIMNPLLQQKGKEELAKNRAISAFDGELPSNSPYKYGTAYRLGDLVEMQNSDGVSNRMRVTEQIFVSDNEGERSYPTLTLDQYVTKGSWLGWPSTQVWEDAVGYWRDQA